MNNWKICRNRAGSLEFFVVLRVRDTAKPMHAGNVEYYGESYATESEALIALKEAEDTEA